MPRLFIAVWPTEEAVEELAMLPRKDQRGVRFVPPENWHITLRFLGEANPDVVIAAVDDVVLPSATVQLGPGVDVLSDRALVVPAHGLDHLADAVRDATANIGQPARRRFVGHVTLARLKPNADMPRALGAFVQAEFDVHEIALVQSRLEAEGARYSTIHTWPVG
ncbi:MAG: RNA 2',3'-cyclic phosphodiesterase [Actinobacteria bacterium]|nr:RNA 2',3'-cyclic phosphodiesterase [Actinomycetota bacterium]